MIPRCELNDDIDQEFSETEILKCIKGLKNSKANVDDLIVNEYIKSTANILMPLYVQLFNLLFN